MLIFCKSTSWSFVKTIETNISYTLCQDIAISHWGGISLSFTPSPHCALVAFNFCRFCVIIRFFHSCHKGQWPPTSKDFYPRFYPLHFLSYLYSWERASVFNVECQTRKLLVPFLSCLWYDAVLDWGLKPGHPAIEASTLPLGYRGGGACANVILPYWTTFSWQQQKKFSSINYPHISTISVNYIQESPITFI